MWFFPPHTAWKWIHNTSPLQPSRNLAYRNPRYVVAEDGADDLGLWFIDFDSIPGNAVSIHIPEAHQFSVLEALPNSPFAVVADRFAFFLRKGSENRQHQLAISADGVDILLLEEDVDAYGLQLPHRLQKRHGVSGEPGNRLRNHHVNGTGLAIRKEPLEFSTVVLGTRKCLVGVDPDILPFLFVLDQGTVVTDLRR